MLFAYLTSAILVCIRLVFCDFLYSFYYIAVNCRN